jgi:hypothetical protein
MAGVPRLPGGGRVFRCRRGRGALSELDDPGREGRYDGRPAAQDAEGAGGGRGVRF